MVLPFYQTRAGEGGGGSERDRSNPVPFGRRSDDSGGQLCGRHFAAFLRVLQRVAGAKYPVCVISFTANLPQVNTGRTAGISSRGTFPGSCLFARRRRWTLGCGSAERSADWRRCAGTPLSSRPTNQHGVKLTAAGRVGEWKLNVRGRKTKAGVRNRFLYLRSSQVQS